MRRLDERVLPPIAKVLARLGRGARRLRIIRFVAVIISLSVVLVAVYAAGRQPAPTYPPNPPLVRLGVVDGDSIPAYVTSSKAKLDALAASNSTARYFALVSMSAYLDPQRLATDLSDPSLQIVYVIMRVRSPYQTQIFQIYAPDLPQDVVRGMLATADKTQQDADDYVSLEGLVQGSSRTDRTLLATYKQEAVIARLEANSYRSLCKCAYAAVVHATPAALEQLAIHADVRSVEPALSLAPDSALFQPPFPDQHTLAEPPPLSAPTPAH